MRLVRVEMPAGGVVVGRLAGEMVEPILAQPVEAGRDAVREALAAGVDLVAAPLLAPAFPLASAKLLSPLAAPQKIICIGLNYADHAKEANLELPAAPVAFAKFANCLYGSGATVSVAKRDSVQLDYEAELAVVIGRQVRNISEADALSAVFAYANANDLSARDAQFADKQWVRGKSFDGFCPLGPWLLTADEITNPQKLAIRCRVNGRTLQDSNTDQMVFGVAQLVSYLSRTMTLEPGDLILTGTPVGVGLGQKPALFLTDGDVVEVEIDGLGVLRTVIAHS